MALPRQTVAFDERRNSSRVFPVPPNALPDAQRALARLRFTSPALVQWLEDGAPRLSEDDHLARFGEPYDGKGRKR